MQKGAGSETENVLTTRRTHPMFQVRCCIQCKATTNVKGNHLLDCEHMWDGKRLRKGVEAHAIHRKCIPNWQDLSKDPKWWCNQLFCLSLRSTYDKRQAQCFPTYLDDMKCKVPGPNIYTRSVCDGRDDEDWISSTTCEEV